MAKKLKQRPLTVKQKKFAIEMAKTGNGTQSALKVYNTTSENIASTIASDNLRKPRIRKTVDDIIFGLENQAKTVLKEGLTAMKQIAYDGEIIESEDIVDHAERRKYLSLLSDLAGWKAPKVIENKTMKIVAQFNDMTEQQLQIALDQELGKLQATL